MSRSKAIRMLEALYAEVPRLECAGKCQACCEPFRIGWREWERIVAVTGPLVVMDRKVCPMLTAGGQCSVHSIRPMLCRIWYTVENNPCPHGCRPDKYLTQQQAADLLLAANEISQHRFAGPAVEMANLENRVSQMLMAENVKWQ